MRLDMRVRKALTKELAKRYQKARKKEKGKILDEFISITNYNAAMLHGFSETVKGRSLCGERERRP